ncbi:hypothetical protein BH10ACT7_BH10ACT7_09810 [soil metagenome]
MKKLLPALTLVAVILTGCVADPNAQLSESARQTLASLEDLGREERVAAALALAGENEADARLAFGVDRALGGTEIADEVLDDLHAQFDEITERRELTTTFVRSSFMTDSSGPSGLDTFVGTGFVAIGWIGEQGVDSAGKGNVGSDIEEHGGTRTETTITDDGVSAGYSTELSSGEATAQVSAETDLQFCPDPNGNLELTGKTSLTLRVKNVSMAISLEVTATGQLDDSANYVSSEYTYRYQTGATIDGKGEFFDHSGNSNGDLTINRGSSNVTVEFQQSAVDAAAALADMVAGDLYRNAKRGWESGRCVTVTVTPSADPENLELSSEVSIEVAPHSTLDGQATGGTVVATFSGSGSLDRDGSTVDAVATYTYTASDEKGFGGTMTIETRSNRGVGKTTLGLVTGTQAFIAEGSDGAFSGSGTICSLTAPFTFAGSGISFEFTPANGEGGTFRLSGSDDGVSYTGDGTYVVVRGSDGIATSLVVDGDVVVNSSEGTTTAAPADMTVVLTPTEPCA